MGKKCSCELQKVFFHFCDGSSRVCKQLLSHNKRGFGEQNSIDNRFEVTSISVLHTNSLSIYISLVITCKNGTGQPKTSNKNSNDIECKTPSESYSVKLSSNEILLLKLRANSLSVQFREHLDMELVGRTSPFQWPRKNVEQKSDQDCSDKQHIIMLEKILDHDYMFTVLPRESRSKYAQAFRPLRLGPNVTVFKQGDRPDKFYAIETGSFLVTVNKDQTRLVGAGQTFGELAMVYQCTRSATVTSTEESNLWYLDRATFHKAVEEIERIRETKLTSYLRGLDWQAFVEEDREEDDVTTLEKFSRRLVFHRFPPKSEVQCVSQSSTIFHVVSGSISHVPNKEKKKCVMYNASSSWFEVCRADEIAREGKCFLSASNAWTTVIIFLFFSLSLSPTKTELSTHTTHCRYLQ